MRDSSWMGNMVTHVYVKFKYDRLCIEKALGNFGKSDKNKSRNNVRSTLGSFLDPVITNMIGQKQDA